MRADDRFLMISRAEKAGASCPDGVILRIIHPERRLG
jgi:hypothetical protein